MKKNFNKKSDSLDKEDSVHIFRKSTRDGTLIQGVCTPTWSWDWFKELLDLWCTAYEGPVPKIVSRVLQNEQNPTFYKAPVVYGETESKSWVTLMSSMKVIRRPHGWGRLTIRRSNNTLVICSGMISCQGKRRSATKINHCFVPWFHILNRLEYIKTSLLENLNTTNSVILHILQPESKWTSHRNSTINVGVCWVKTNLKHGKIVIKEQSENCDQIDENYLII